MCLPPREDPVAYESKTRRTRPNDDEDDDDDDRPRVTFQDSDSHEIHEIPTALSCLENNQDRRQLWYIRDDIQGFRRQAQLISEQLLRHGDAEEETRGLELRMSLQRQDRKHLVVKRILDAQDDDSTPEELAAIAQEHSVWSRKLALAQAHKDYYAAYHPNLTSAVIPEFPALHDCGRDAVTKKRSLLLGSSSPSALMTQSQPTGRRVRCRMF